MITKNEETISIQLIRKIEDPVSTLTNPPTPTGKTGILVNGVEILNYKSNDVVYYGPLDEISVVTPGSGYDISNPPILDVTDGAVSYTHLTLPTKRIV